MIGGIIVGILFGLVLAAPPGPMNAIIADESINKGWNAGVQTGFGAMVSDMVLLLLAYMGVITIITSREWLQGALIGIGGVVMLVFAYRLFRDGRNKIEWEVKTNDRNGFLKALGLGITNPWQVAFWAGMSAALFQNEGIETVAGMVVGITGWEIQLQSIEVIIGIFVGISIWILVFPTVLIIAGEKNEQIFRVISLASSGILAVFGGVFLAKSMSMLFIG
ncbi:MAG TPA: LysE family transporter [Halobacteriales archaeon]|uniref:LysE family translocator n=1 Tax=Candidatus Hikarchaeum yamanae TaxID=2675326 RepID=UPI0017A82609|nr:LysE family transporter [Halobacteriales archaeon]|tara:strand:+ start:40023 stop:40685 length:663 start_codon:yes stop_codon:yes gene_type:complete